MSKEILIQPGQELAVNTREYITALEADIAQRTSVEPLMVPGWNLWVEKYPMLISGLSGVAAHFGERITREDMDARISETLKANTQSIEENWVGPVGYTAGFGAIYRAPEDSTREEKDAATFDVGVRMASYALELKGWKPEEVDVVDFANSAADDGMSTILRTKLVKDLGMRDDIEVTGTFMACDGSGNALYQRLRDEKSVGKKVLLLSVDSVGSEIPSDPSLSDTNSQQIFSNGAAAIAYLPGIDLKLVTQGKTEIHEDKNHALSAIARYERAIESDSTIDPQDATGLTRIIGNERMIQLPHPETGGFSMRGRETAKFFWEHAERNIAEVCDQYESLFLGRQLDFAIVHQPSYPVFKGLQHRFEKRRRIKGQGLELPFEWVVPDGNSSGATSLIAFNRSMSEFKSGNHVLYASFGAGGSFTTFIVEVGG